MPLKVLDILQVDDLEDEVLLVRKLSALIELKKSTEHLVILVCEEVKDEKKT